MPQSAHRLLIGLLAVFISVVIAHPARGQSTSDNGSTLPVLMQSVSFVNDGVDAQAPQAAPPPQHKHHEGLGIGIKGGPAFGSLSTSGAVAFKTQTGYQISLFLGGNRPGVFGVATEITFIKRYASAVGLTTTSSASTALEIPLLFRFNFGSHNLDGVSAYFMAGPAIDFNLEKFGLAQLVKNEGYDINLIFSGGVEITRFIIEVRYNKGLKNLTPNLATSTSTKTHAVILLFGVRFN
jgi:hypothetical protein